MGNSVKNIAIVLGVATLAFGGYYFYSQFETAQFDAAANEQEMQRMLSETQVFIERGRTLGQISLSFDLFEDTRFISLRSFSTEIEDRPIGRDNPFSGVNGSGGSSGF